MKCQISFKYLLFHREYIYIFKCKINAIPYPAFWFYRDVGFLLLKYLAVVNIFLAGFGIFRYLEASTVHRSWFHSVHILKVRCWSVELNLFHAVTGYCPFIRGWRKSWGMPWDGGYFAGNNPYKYVNSLSSSVSCMANCLTFPTLQSLACRHLQKGNDDIIEPSWEPQKQHPLLKYLEATEDAMVGMLCT